MSKAGKYAGYGAGIGALIMVIINGIKQYQEIQVDPYKEFNWGELLQQGGKGAFFGGAIGLTAGLIKDEITKNTKPINTDAHLDTYVEAIVLNTSSITFKESERFCVELIAFLNDEFSSFFSADPEIRGSIDKGTAIEGKSDFDIFLRFNSDSFKIKDMYYAVYEALRTYQDPDIIEVREQKKSIGVLFEIGGKTVKIDVVPQRDIDSSTSNAGHLFVSSTGTFTKTDVDLQDEAIKLTPVKKKLIMILKKLKDDQNIPMSSYMIQLLVEETYNRNRGYMPKKFTDKLMLVVRFIFENIETIRLVSPENTNNIISNIADSDKSTIRNKMKEFIDEYEYHPNYILEAFPID